MTFIIQPRTRHPDVAVNDILENLTNVQFQLTYIDGLAPIHRDIANGGASLSLWTHTEWYVIHHWNKCIFRMTGVEDGKALFTDTTNLNNKDYNKILTTVEDYMGMSIFDFSFGMIDYK